MSRNALLRYRAERLLRKDFFDLRARVIATVRSRLRARGVRLDPHDLDACYGQAWHGLYSRLLAGEQIEDVAAWLILVTYRRALDELRAGSRQSRACEAQAELAQPSGLESYHGADFAAELDDRARLRQVLEALNGMLSPRERQAASLCYLQGLSRAQAAQRMGIGTARMRKLMDGSAGRAGVAAKVEALLETIGAGRWCERQGSLMRAYAFGILDPDGERHALARAHLRQCPACRAFVLSLRGLATVLPPLPLPFASLPAASRAVPRRARPTGRRLTHVLAPHGIRAPLAKLALIFAATLSVGGGMVVFARGASRHTARSTSVLRSGLEVLEPYRRQHRVRPTRLHAIGHRAASPRATGRRAVRDRRDQSVLSPSLPQRPRSEPATVTSSSARPAAEASAGSEEFSPEQASSRRG
jgi:RNA polymerase sigma factor (sigma-70 family)